MVMNERRWNMVWRIILGLIVALGLLTAAQAQTPVKPGMNLFSPEQDAEIGRRSAAEADRQLPLVRNAAVQSYVDAIGQRLARQAPGPNFQYRFRVVDSSELNAFALPGGYIYLNRGVIETARNEGEVAGVLAHEVAHVALRHGTQNASKASLTQTGIGIIGGLLGKNMGQDTAQILNLVGGFGLNALFLKYSREAESQADVLGAQIMARAGYSAYDMASFFRTLERSDRRRVANWLSAHPSPGSRVERIEREAALIGSRRDGRDSGQLTAIKSRLGGGRR